MPKLKNEVISKYYYLQNGGVLTANQQATIRNSVQYSNIAKITHFIEIVTPLLQNVTNKNQINRVCKRLHIIPFERLAEFIEITLPLFKDMNNGNQIELVIEELLKIPFENLEKFINIILPLCQEINNGNQIKQIIEQLIIIPLDELNIISEKAYSKFHKKNGTMVNLNNRLNILKDEMLNLEGVGAAYLKANVHSTNIEIEVKKYIDILYGLNNNLTIEKIKDGINDFEIYIKTHSSGKQQEFLLFALNYFKGNDIILLNNSINSSEILARLWYFAISSNNSENAIYSIMSGLMNSFNKPNFKGTVCPHGILLRLITAVLPGRVGDINNRIINNKPINIMNAITFFIAKPETKKIFQKINNTENSKTQQKFINKLIQQAEIYANENPKINKTKFVKMIAQYTTNNNNNNNNNNN